MKVRQIRLRHYSRPRKRGRRTWQDRLRYVKNRQRELKPGAIIETCGLEVAKILFTDGDNLGYQVIAGKHTGHGSCSIMYCGPIVLRPAAIERRMKIFKEQGDRGLTLRYLREDCRLTDEQIAEWEKEWAKTYFS